MERLTTAMRGLKRARERRELAGVMDGKKIEIKPPALWS